VYPLTSGKLFTVKAEMTFGEIVIGTLLFLLLLVFIIWFIYKVIDRWS